MLFIWILGTILTKFWKPEYPKTRGFLPEPDKNPKIETRTRPEPEKWYPNPTRTRLLLPDYITSMYTFFSIRIFFFFKFKAGTKTIEATGIRIPNTQSIMRNTTNSSTIIKNYKNNKNVYKISKGKEQHHSQEKIVQILWAK